jgi:hypothetical protein
MRTENMIEEGVTQLEDLDVDVETERELLDLGFTARSGSVDTGFPAELKGFLFLFFSDP